MTIVRCSQRKCNYNKDGICQLGEIILEQEPYHSPECENMDCSKCIRRKRFNK